ncbi:MAG TPA: GAF domain-containing protein, partial [Burkholderiales bacterium]|nr:GAF domain-containing protein [Burkholderiales bacterium]
MAGEGGFEKVRERYPIALNDRTLSGRVMLEGKVMQLVPITGNPAAPPETVIHAKVFGGGFECLISAPMVRDGKVIGAITTARRAPVPFDERQVALIRSFANQAVIAIENARLFNETKEALERQTATSEILRVISSSPTDLQPVFDTIARNFIALCGAAFGGVYTYDGRLVHLGGVAGSRSEQERRTHRAKYPVGVDDSSVVSARTIRARAPVHVEDALADAHYDPERAKRLGVRRILGVPMLREGEPLGALVAGWYEAGPTPKQHEELLRTFADQAAIAIENVRLFNETKEALARQTATSEILGVISSSPTDIAPVFDAILKNATELSGAHLGILNLRDGEGFRTVAQRSANAEFAKYAFERGAFKPVGATARMILERQAVQVPDLREGDAYRAGQVGAVKWIEMSGARSFLAVPLLKEGQVIGSISIYRPEVRPFSQEQIRLVSTFAAQAVIAIENVRLFNETKEALERQTATSDILKVISSSPTELQPVFDTILEKAMHLCGAHLGFLGLYDGQKYEHVAQRGSSAEFAKWIARGPFVLDPRMVTARALLEGKPVQEDDLRETSSYREGVESIVKTAELGGARTILAVPMLKEGRAVGAILIYRPEVRPFTQKQIDLVSTFASQAVIAIENVRLFKELQATNANLRETLEQQTATAEILKVISKSPTDARPVFETIVRSSVHLCSGAWGAVFTCEGNMFHLGAQVQPTPEVEEAYRRGFPQPIDDRTPSGRAIVERRPVNVADIHKTDYAQGVKDRARLAGWRSVLTVPMMRDDVPIGAVAVTREEATLFDESYVALLQTFADQAVIAIENARLFKELQDRTEALTKSVGQLTALGEVGQAISSTLDLEKVLKTIVSRAVQLAGLDGGWIYEFDDRDEGFHLRAAEHVEEEIIAVSRKSPIRLGEGAVGRAGATREPVVVEDVLDPSYQSRVRELLIKSGSRAVLAVPLLREDLLLGALAVSRKSPGPFAPEVVELLKTFATQSAVAIQNARLFNETKEALELQTATSEVLRVISGTPADPQPVFDAIAQSAAR